MGALEKYGPSHPRDLALQAVSQRGHTAISGKLHRIEVKVRPGTGSSACSCPTIRRGGREGAAARAGCNGGTGKAGHRAAMDAVRLAEALQRAQDAWGALSSVDSQPPGHNRSQWPLPPPEEPPPVEGRTPSPPAGRRVGGVRHVSFVEGCKEKGPGEEEEAAAHLHHPAPAAARSFAPRPGGPHPPASSAVAGGGAGAERAGKAGEPGDGGAGRRARSICLLDVQPLCYLGRVPAPSAALPWLDLLFQECAAAESPIIAVSSPSPPRACILRPRSRRPPLTGDWFRINQS